MMKFEFTSKISSHFLFNFKYNICLNQVKSRKKSISCILEVYIYIYIFVFVYIDNEVHMDSIYTNMHAYINE